MRENNTIQLSDATPRSAAAVAFYNRYRMKVNGIETTTQRNDILSAMQQDFERHIRAYPQDRDKLSEVYQLLKQKCWEV